MKVTERRAGTYLGIKREDYRQGARYHSLLLPLEEDQEEYEKGQMIRLSSAVPINVRDAIAHIEVNPVLLKKGFCSHQRVVDPDRGEHSPDVLVRLKDDLRAEELEYLFKVYIAEIIS